MPRPEPTFQTVAPVRAVRGTTHYDDIMCRAPKQYLQHDRATRAHESQHHLHAGVRNAEYLKTRARVGAMYCFAGRVIVLPEPPISLRDVAPLVPKSLRGYRYDLYLNRQLQSWGGTAQSLYLFDEGFCYWCDSMVSLEDWMMGVPREDGLASPGEPDTRALDPLGYPRRHLDSLLIESEGLGSPADGLGVTYYDGVSACLEFSVYALAHLMAVRWKAKTWLDANPNYMNMLSFFVRWCATTYKRGASIDAFKRILQPNILTSLKSSSEAATFRHILSSDFDNHWL
jgi:hypothetical protein